MDDSKNGFGLYKSTKIISDHKLWEIGRNREDFWLEILEICFKIEFFLSQTKSLVRQASKQGRGAADCGEIQLSFLLLNFAKK